ncbi:MAG TPA: hypothetical protein VHC70_01840 [Phycisphaerales bacterium]|jgi:hypothetical protein|nr:hypothetical protein [Phycisphaerales bacterium]
MSSMNSSPQSVASQAKPVAAPNPPQKPAQGQPGKPVQQPKK